MHEAREFSFYETALQRLYRHDVREPDEGEIHSWGTIIGVMLFLAFIGFMLSMAS